MKKIGIRKGVNLYVEQTDKFDVSVFCVLMRLPLERERATANALLAKALLKGCNKYITEREIAVRLEELCAVMDCQIMKKGEEQIIQLYFKTLPGYTEEIFELAGDVLFEPLFNGIDEAKRDLRDDIEGIINNKRRYAVERCIENMCADEDYGIRGDGYAEDIDSVDIQEAYDYAMENADVAIMAVGSTDSGILADYVNKYLPFEERDELQFDMSYLKNPHDVREIEEKMDISQGKLAIGIRMNIDPAGREWYKALVANELFGGNANSELFMEAREKESLCYYISSKLLRFKSIMIIEAGIEDKNKEKVEEIVENAFKNVGDEDIETAKTSIVNSFKAAEDKAERIMDYSLGQIILDSSLDMEDSTEEIKKVRSIEGVFDSCVFDTVYMLRS